MIGKTIAGACVVVMGILLVAATAPPAHAAMTSCYADTTDGYLGQTTADGSTTSSTEMLVAHRTLAFDTELWVKVDGRAPVKVRVADRGPFVSGRSLDVTWPVAVALGYNTCAAWGVRKATTWRVR